ncbi:MAG: UDP-glucose 4-epimerase GalE, partial [Legionellales bacterium]|nr:UDP-glucose 4-epimerase GalE [Legionellales bacterium]
LKFFDSDIRDTASLIEILDEVKASSVIHFAGLKAVGESETNPMEYFDNNVGGAISLFKAMRETGVKSLIFSSSATVYGLPEYLPIDENHKTAPTSVYGKTKLQVEEILNHLSSADSSWRVICLRYFNPAGAHSSGLIGESPRGTPNNLVPYLVKVVSGDLDHLKVFGDDYDTPDGTGIRDYIHVSDLAAGHTAALEYLRNSASCFEIFNLGTGSGHSVMEVIKTFEEISPVPISYEIVGRRLGDVACNYADATKANEILGWNSQLNLKNICESAWAYQRSQIEDKKLKS